MRVIAHAAGLWLVLTYGLAFADEGLTVNISQTLAGVDVVHNGQQIRIQRNQDTSAVINERFARTSRTCPPFCIQPAQIAPGVDTIAELEVLDYLQRIADGDDTILVIDSRGPNWVRHGTIPGSIHVHYKRLSLRSASETDIAEILEKQFDAERNETLWNFQHAKTLVLFCNGPWCGQSPTNIRGLLKLGYPPSKLKWYRGGMQAWEALGLTTVLPDS